MKHENMTFSEAVKALAEKGGIELPAADKAGEAKTLYLMNLNGIAADFFHRCLVTEKVGERARQYLSRRKIEKDIIDKFQLGYAPSGDGVIGEFRRKDVPQEVFRESGLFTSDKSKILFRQRIIFPIFNPRGKVIGFGARVLGNSMPKYINSPETPVYHKSANLYGLNLAREHIRSQGKAIVVEGYFDMIRIFQYGIGNVVASLGTALAESQVNLLRRYTKEVVMVYDADTAGVEATLRGLDLFIESGFRVGIVALPRGEDPDSFLLKRGKEVFAKEVNKAKNFLDYKLGILTSRYNPLTVEGRVEIVNEMLPTISKIGHAVERSEYIKRLAQCLSIDEEAISIELRKLRSKRRGKAFSVMETQSLTPLVIERTLLQLILEDEKVLKWVKKQLNPEDFSHPDYRHILKVVLELDSSEPQKVMSRLQDEKFNRIIAQLLVKPVPYIEREKAIQDCIEKIKKQRIKRRRAEIQRQIQEKESKGDMEAVRVLLREYQGLIKRGANDKTAGN
jgi:DNA primase